LIPEPSVSSENVRPKPDTSYYPALATLALFVGLAVLHTWPLATAPGTLSRNDNGDFILHEWIMAWVSHQVVTNPLHLFDANIFYPERYTLAYSDHLFVQSMMGAPLLWAGASGRGVALASESSGGDGQPRRIDSAAQEIVRGSGSGAFEKKAMTPFLLGKLSRRHRTEPGEQESGLGWTQPTFLR